MYQVIKLRAAKLHMTIREIERRCELPFGSIKRWDRIAPSVYKVIRVARVLGCTVDELIADADEVEDATVSA